MENNNFKTVEEKWMKFWEEHPELYKASDESDKTKKYVLVEFPYPSGSGLHVGHAFTFTGGDVYARFKRMQGYNVMFPMGWDAFGLPTENYAIKMKRKPQEVTHENTEMFKSQMKKLAFSFDWSREVNTTDPNYYKWTQWIFIQLVKKGLAYKEEMPINWCPSCKIGLANEEVVNGKCERCGSEVERRTISQWVVKITEYADKLIEGLEKTDFIEKVKMQQINWIGKSEGAKVKFQISNDKFQNKEENFLEVFTTRPDTLFGVSFVVISPEHDFINKLVSGSDYQTSEDQKQRIKEYIDQAKKKSDLERAELQKDKTGVDTGIKLINPVNGKEVPLYVADYVLMGYGTGVVMGVPAHDQRDYDFATKYNLDIIPVIVPKEGWDFSKRPYGDVLEGKIVVSGDFLGLSPSEAIRKMKAWIEEKGIGKRTSMYHLRDWIFSRQHYWGEPIPMIKCKEHGWVPVPEEQLPIVLPEVEHYEPTDDGRSPLANITEWVKTTCPVCGKEAERETDTMPNWAGSDWYYLAYCFAKKLNEVKADYAKATSSQSDIVGDIFSNSREVIKKWMPVDVYIGGDEHNTLHLLYSRFIYKFLYDLGVLPNEHLEPYYKRMSHGVILGPDNQRMSKSKGNVIVPEVVADKYGVDVVRTYLMFMGPFDATMAWNEKTLMGVKRFLDRFEKYVKSQISDVSKEVNDNNNINSIIHKTIKGVTDDIENFRYNTAIAKMMECLNELSASNQSIGVQNVKILLQLIAPLAPYMAENLWSQIRDESDSLSVHISEWPKYEEKYLVEETINLPIAINGKVREQMKISNDKLHMTNEVISQAKSLEKIKGYIDGKEIVKEIYIPGKMVNIVVK